MKHSLVNTAKYLIFLIFCFTILKFIPSKKIGPVELLSMAIIISVGFFSIDIMAPINSDKNLTNIEQMNNLNKPDYMVELDDDNGDVELDNVVELDNNVDIDDLVNNVKKQSSSCTDCVNKVEIIREQFKNKLKVVEENQKESIETQIKKLEDKLSDLAKENELLRMGVSNKVDPQVDSLKSVNADFKNRKLKFDEDQLSIHEFKNRKQRSDEEQLSAYESKNRKPQFDEDQLSAYETKDKKHYNEETSNKTSNKFTSKLVNIYLNILEKENILTVDEIEKIKMKYDSGLFTVDELVNKLELLMKNTNIKISDVGYNDWMSQIGKDMLIPQQKKHIGANDSTMNNKWDNTYTLLNTDKWRLPTPRPPVCVSNDNCSVCPSTTSGYPINLKEWDNARYVTTSKKQSRL